MQSMSAAVGGNSFASGAVPRSRWVELQRDLILGSGDGVYFAGDARLSAGRAPALRACLEEDGLRVVNAIVETASSGRVARHESVLFALAVAASPKFANAEVNAAALDALPRVALTAAHIRKFAAHVTEYRGWGRSLRAAFARWYVQMPVRELLLQMLKQRRRAKWAHGDLIRMSHPKPETKAQSVLFRWAVEGEIGRAPSELLYGELKQLYGFDQARRASSRYEIIDLIEAYQLTYEMVPERWLGSADVWEALLDSMPYCAMLRNLSKLAVARLVTPQGESTALVVARLLDQRRIARAKVSPVTILGTLLEFRQKHDVPAIASALETAFYVSLANTPASGRRIGVALDGAAPVASTVMAMLAARTENSPVIFPASVSAEDRLDSVMESVKPARPHLDEYPDVDALVVVLGQTGWTQPPRQSETPLVTVAANAAEPEFPTGNGSMLQVVGFDATVPRAVAEFVRM